MLFYLQMKKVRLCLIGSQNSGKTSIVQRWCSPLYPISASKTVGIDMRSMIFEIDTNNVMVQFWDCTGDESFESLLEPYVKNTEMIIIIFDLTCKRSWLRAQFWVEKALDITDHTPICIVGNKLDRESERIIKSETINRYIRIVSDRNAFYCETSAYTGEKCKETLKMCIRESLRHPVHHITEHFNGKKEKSCILM